MLCNNVFCLFYACKLKLFTFTSKKSDPIVLCNYFFQKKTNKNQMRLYLITFSFFCLNKKFNIFINIKMKMNKNAQHSKVFL
jgi:hypothetical protein